MSPTSELDGDICPTTNERIIVSPLRGSFPYPLTNFAEAKAKERPFIQFQCIDSTENFELTWF